MQHVSATWQQGMLLGVFKSCSRAACTRRITCGLSEKGTCFTKGIDQPFPTNHRHGWGACARRSRQRVSFPSTHSWLSLIRVPRRGLPPLSRDWSATEAPDRGPWAQRLRQAPAASLDNDIILPLQQAGMGESQVYCSGPKGRALHLDLALVTCPKPGWGPSLARLNTERCMSALPVQGIVSPDVAPGACQGLCQTHCPAEC